MNEFKKLLSFFLFVLLTGIYCLCGYIFGYHQGYKAGQLDYVKYINKIMMENEK